jgi:hypothetical protein
MLARAALDTTIRTHDASARQRLRVLVQIGWWQIVKFGELGARHSTVPPLKEVHGTIDAAPEGAALIHAVRYLAPDEKPNRSRLIAELEGFVDLMQPGWRDYEKARQFLPAMPVISSIPLAAKGGMNGRPGVSVSKASGLFLCGDWVGPVGLLADAAAISGRSAGEAAAAFGGAIGLR